MIDFIYRCCESDTKTQFRPHWFSKKMCLENLVMTFQGQGYKFWAIHDGPIGPLYDMLQEYEFEIIKIEKQSNEYSLVTSLECGAYSQNSKIYFVEDDYLHTKQGNRLLNEGFELLNNTNTFISLYDHPDRYVRTDDLDFGRTNVFAGKVCHWRTAESTTCTWATTKDAYEEFAYDLAMKHLLNDREFFRSALQMGKKLITPMPGASTHCHIPFLSPIVNWDDIANEF